MYQKNDSSDYLGLIKGTNSLLGYNNNSAESFIDFGFFKICSGALWSLHAFKMARNIFEEIIIYKKFCVVISWWVQIFSYNINYSIQKIKFFVFFFFSGESTLIMLKEWLLAFWEVYWKVYCHFTKLKWFSVTNFSAFCCRTNGGIITWEKVFSIDYELTNKKSFSYFLFFQFHSCPVVSNRKTFCSETAEVTFLFI